MSSFVDRVPKSSFLYQQDAWFSGIDNSMNMLGNAQEASTGEIIRFQNEAIRDCWAVTGNYLRQAMFVLSFNTNVYPDELKEDSECRKMLTRMKART